MGIPAAQSISEYDVVLRGLTNHLQLHRITSQEAVVIKGPGSVQLCQKCGTGFLLGSHCTVATSAAKLKKTASNTAISWLME